MYALCVKYACTAKCERMSLSEIAVEGEKSRGGVKESITEPCCSGFFQMTSAHAIQMQ